VQYFIIASSVCKWYFSHDSNSELDSDSVGFPVFNAVKRVLRYHLGSLAFGSFILAVIWVIRLVFWLLSSMMKQKEKVDPSTGTKIMSTTLACCSCCAKCWNTCLKFLTHQAYIRIALTGENFCAAAKSAFFTLMNPKNLSSGLSYAVVEGLGGIFVVLGTLCISLSSTYLGYRLIQKPEYAAVLTSTFTPTAVFFICAYFIGTIFMNIYGVAIEAIMQCYLLDLKMARSGEDTDLNNCPPAIAEFFLANFDDDGDGRMDADERD